MVIKGKAIPLDANKDIYVRDVNSGKMRIIYGSTYKQEFIIGLGLVTS